MLPRVLISESCLRQVEEELDRVFPDEGVVVPLCALTYREAERSPCETIRLRDLREVVIARVVLVPAAAQQSSPTRVQVLAGGDQQVNARVLEISRRHPRLRACGVLHSHPFALGSTRPSTGPQGDIGGHMIPLLQRNREAGLETCFSFIACRGQGGWRLQGFALDESEQLRELGFAEPVPETEPGLSRLLLPALGQRAPQRTLLRRWRRELRRAGWAHRCDELFDGWVRTIVELAVDLRAVILLPLEFPATPPRFFALPFGQTARRFWPSGTAYLGPGAWREALLQMKEQLP